MVTDARTDAARELAERINGVMFAFELSDHVITNMASLIREAVAPLVSKGKKVVEQYAKYELSADAVTELSVALHPWRTK